jgi:hypothetical protein
MKHIYTLLILLFSAAVLAAAPIDNLIVNNGNWNAPPSWSLNRVPVNGDTVVIPAGLTVVVGTTPNYTASTLYIKVNGTLYLLQTASLKLGVNSIIKVNAGGTVSGDLTDNDHLNSTI